VLINQSTPGTISFKAPVNYPVGIYPGAIVTGDFTHNGKLDLAVVNGGNSVDPSATTTLSILKGNGDGSFQPAATQLLWNGSGGAAIAAGDFGTGQIDLAVANFSTGQIMILLGHGDATFTPADIYRVGAGPESIAAMDFNGDGISDLAIDNINDNTIALLLGKGDGTFVPVVDRAQGRIVPFGWVAGPYPTELAVGDLTGDGKLDIVTANFFNATITVLRNTTPTPVQLAGVISRKVHGSAGTFDINLPLTGTRGIECRSGGASGDYMLVFTFANTLSSVGGANVTSGTGSVASSNIESSDAHNDIINLTGVTNAQVITVTLSNVTDSAGDFSSAVAGSMGVLLGDTSGDGVVNSADITQTRRQSGNVADSSNFREDVTTDGVINSADITLVRRQSGTALP